MPVLIGSIDVVADMIIYLDSQFKARMAYWGGVFEKLVGKLPENPSDSKLNNEEFKTKFMEEMCSLKKPITFPENSSGYNLVKIYRQNIKSKLNSFKFPDFMYAFATDNIPDYMISIEFCKPSEIPCKKAGAIMPIYGKIDRMILARIFLDADFRCNRCCSKVMFKEDNYVENGIPKHRCADLNLMASTCKIV